MNEGDYYAFKMSFSQLIISPFTEHIILRHKQISIFNEKINHCDEFGGCLSRTGEFL